MRRALLWIGAPLAALAVAFGCLQLVSLIAHERTRTPVSFERIGIIELDLGAGGIEIVAGPGDSVTGTRTVDRSWTSPRIRETVVDGTLRIATGCRALAGPNCSVRYRLTVPAIAAVSGSSSGGGIRITGLSGPINLRSSGGGITATDTAGGMMLDSSGGGIRVTNATGPLTLDSSGGGVRVTGSRSHEVIADSSGGGVTLEFVEAPQTVDADSSGGGVTIVVPNDETAYAVDARSSGGGRTVDVRTDPASDRRIRVRSSGGGVTVRYPTAATG